jgi:allophanate hydrolase
MRSNVMTSHYDGSFSLPALRSAYAGGLTPADVVEAVLSRIESIQDNPVWISLVARERALARARSLARSQALAPLPLFGVPFAVKDNIDVAGMETTAGCPQFAYLAGTHAHVVDRLEAAGAICIGKTNLDQFATGLVGTRSPYGACRNAFDARYISGGSSSGSALAVALGQVSFALGTDTAGSGRIPAAFNNIVGLKPTRGLISTRGVVPACRSLDCVSVFALDCSDALEILKEAAGFDPKDPYSRADRQPRPLPPARPIGVPRRDQQDFANDGDYARLYQASIARCRALGAEVIDIDFAPFMEAQRMLYEGPWIAERAAALAPFMGNHPEAVDTIVRSVLDGAGAIGAVETFKAFHRLAELHRDVQSLWKRVSCLLLPAAPTLYRLEEIRSRPIELNARLGYYTNFVNLLDLAAVNVPGGMRSDGLPFGLSLVGPACSERALARLGSQLHAALGLPAGVRADAHPVPLAEAPAADTVRLAVVGAHLSGLPLNHELTARDAVLLERTRTSACYRLHALQCGNAVARPGMTRSCEGEAGGSIELELWEMPLEHFGSFVALVPPPLAIGTVALCDGRQVKGFLCEPHALRTARDITAWGGWRNWLAHAADATRQ